MKEFIDHSGNNIVGLNKQEAIIYISTDTIKAEIIYTDNNAYYLHNDSLGVTTTLNKQDVNKIEFVGSKKREPESWGERKINELLLKK